MKITFATYNILHGHYSDLILKNLSILTEKGVDLICLQEADPPFKTMLSEFVKNKGWEVICFDHSIGSHLAILWDPAKLTIENSEHFLLPTLSKPSLRQKLTNYKVEIIQRGALSVSFITDGKRIRITNTHLAWEGGSKHRIPQLEHIKSDLSKKSSDYEILAGDFNTVAPALFHRIQEKQIEKVLAGWSNTLPNLKWSCDTSYTAPRDGVTKYAKLGKLFGIKFRCKLDYIFTKNLKTISAEMLDWPGSDHRPLIATFEV